MFERKMDWLTPLCAFIGGNALGIFLDQLYYSGSARINNISILANYTNSQGIIQTNRIRDLLVDAEFINDSGRTKSIVNIRFHLYNTKTVDIVNKESNLPLSIVLPEKEVKVLSATLKVSHDFRDVDFSKLEEMYFTIYYQIGSVKRSKTIKGSEFKWRNVSIPI